MNKRILVALLGLCTLALAACAGQRLPTGGAGTPSGTKMMDGAAPLDAALVTPDFGWVLTADRLLLSRDGGATFTAANTSLPAGPVRAAYFRDARNGAAASASGDSVIVARTSDGGETWRSSTLRAPSGDTTGYSAIAMSFAGINSGALLARVATSQAFSMGTLFATTDGGSSWSANAAPEAGQVSIDAAGRIWLAGSTLDVTSDQGRSWTRAKLDVDPTADAITVATPVGDTLPVTVIGSGKTHVELLTTTDQGLTWGRPTLLPVQAKTGPGIRVVVANTGTGLLVFDRVGGHAYHGKNGIDLRPSGLPDGVQSASFAADGKAGWALATYGTCAQGKQDCALHYELASTADGGASWHALAAWIVPVG